MKRPLVILSIDGGGPHNLMTTILLERLEKARHGFLDAIDLVAGVSSGSIATLMLAASRDRAAGIARAIEIQRDSKIYGSNHALAQAIVGLTGTGPFLSNNRPRAYFDALFGDLTLGGLHMHTAIPALLIDNRGKDSELRSLEPRIMHNITELPAATPDVRCADALIRTTAAPILEPVFQGYIDGGVFADNPSTAGLALGSALVRHRSSDAHMLRSRALEEILLLSMGTGANPIYMEYDEPNTYYGYQAWLLDRKCPMALIDAIFEAGQDYADYLCKQLLEPERYFRLDPPLPKRVNTRSHHESELQWIEEFAMTVDLTPTIQWLDRSGWFAKPERERELVAAATHSDVKRKNR